MNNNYHTQMDKQNNNMLNEIAASNHLLQQQMQNFQGTPINKGQPNPQLNTMTMNPATMNQTAMNPATMNPTAINPTAMNPAAMNPQLMQQLYAQQMAQQAQQNQLYQQQQRLNNQSNQQYQQQQQPIADDDEIELSDSKPEPKQKIVSNPDTKQPQQINKQIQQLIQNNEENADAVVQQQAVQKPDKNAIQPKKPTPQLQYPPQIKYVPVEKPQNKTMEYIVIPILLIVVFVALVHPKTSAILEKYLPQLTSTKGILIRGAVLAVLYLVIRFITSSMSKK
ncbi:hypothetical protein QJ856_gp0900 [Tupanvirus deep ocean]|uniref:Uncharacterized protein n=2 Tax=Tupanvirus TaxID=2094720 RepID=A0AC62A7Z8_9VIRU|nr:hypothetical protein QJ856_gp0900 [Tupanvirus deep ocean]QKU33857.1 hypothetical protein [Tupanvirus deep ocean]